MSSAPRLVNGQPPSTDLALGLSKTSDALNMVSSFKDLCLSKMDHISAQESSAGEFVSEFGGFSEAETKAKCQGLPDHVKELMLIHLDFIQLQSEQLTTKEKIINDLKVENEGLKQRIARMQRRLNNKQKSLVNGDCGGGSGDEGEVTCNGQLRKRRRLSSEGSAPLSSDEIHGKRQLRTRKEDEGAKSDALTTPDLYYTSIGEEDCTWTLDPPSPSRINLEVPKWRVKVYSGRPQPETEESITNETYDRRHLRLFIDEKRRKRWDVQRIREQRHNEKLRQREERNRKEASGRTDEEVFSFYPTIDKVHTLSVMDAVPISFCGIPLPATTNTEFSLPWLSGKDMASLKTRPFRKSKR